MQQHHCYLSVRGDRTTADLLDAQNHSDAPGDRGQVKAGLDIVTDGQIRWNDPISYLAAKLDNIELQGSVPFFDTDICCRQPVFTGHRCGAEFDRRGI